MERTHHPEEHITVEDDGQLYDYSLEDQPEPDETVEITGLEEQFDESEDKIFIDNLKEMMEDGSDTSIDMDHFELEAVAPDELGAFPKSPDESPNPQADGNRVIDWHLSRLGVALDEIKDAIADDADAKEWLELKMLVAAGKRMNFGADKWAYELGLEETVKPFVTSRGGDMHEG